MRANHVLTFIAIVNILKLISGLDEPSRSNIDGHVASKIDTNYVQEKLSQRTKSSKSTTENEAMPKAVLITVMVVICVFSCIIIIAIIVLIQNRFEGDQDRIRTIARYENEAERRCHCAKRRSELERAAILHPGANFIANPRGPGLILAPRPVTVGTRVMAPFKFKSKQDEPIEDEKVVEPAQDVTDQEKAFS